MRITVIILLTLIGLSIQAQEKVFVDEALDEVKKEDKATYYLLAKYDDEGNLSGNYDVFYLNDTMYIDGFYYKGEPYGRWTWYWENGKKKETGSYEKGVEIGEWFTYFDNNRESGFKRYEKGEVVDEWPTDETVFNEVDEMPRYPSKECEALATIAEKDQCARKAMLDFLYSPEYPTEIPGEERREGTCQVQLTVDIEGNIINMFLSGSSGNEILDEAAVKHAEKLPKFTPGKRYGKLVPVQLTLPIRFALEEK